MKWVRATSIACAKHWHLFTLLLVCYLPILITQPGKVSADTKTYLFLNPGELLTEAASLWSSSFGAGTVTHQYIGYLWPMGPYFWLTDTIGVPDWLAQRFWWGSLIFLACLGTFRLARTIGIHQNYALIAALMYGLSPYALNYLARLSGILLPWVGLPWLLMFLIRSRQEGGWKWPARAALVIGTIGTVNATTLFFVIVGLGIWLSADVLSGFARWRDSAKTFLLVGIGSIGISLWWLTSLVMQSSYGLPILRYSETYETVAKASLPQELLRGLGYWFFYGDEYAGRWIGPSAPYMYNLVVIVGGFVVVAIGLISLATTQSRYRIHLSLLVLIGLGIAVGASPLTNSSIYGQIFDIVVNNESGFALRSTPRAMPLVLIALALASGYGLESFARTMRKQTTGLFASASIKKITVRAICGIAVLAVVINNFAWFTQRSMTEAISRDENLPAYWLEAANAIDTQRDPATGFGRTYEFPAVNFADYWWGGTVDPVLPGLINTEYVAKEMIPQGSEATTDLLSAFESKMVDGRPDMGVLGSLAAILSANTATWRADIAYDNHLTARPEYLAPSLNRTPPGPTVFTGPVIATSQRAAIVDETWFGNTRIANYPLLQVWSIPNARPLLSQSNPKQATTIVGSGEGLINALAANVVDASNTFIYAGSREYLPTSMTQEPIAHLVLTDTNRNAQRQWSSIAQQTGRTERSDEATSPPTKRAPTDQRLNPFTDNYRLEVPIEQMTTSRLVGNISQVRASSYGHPVVLTPEARPENVVDNDPRTTWVVGVRSRAAGEWIRISYREPITASSVKIDMSARQPGGRLIERARLDLLDAKGLVISSNTFAPNNNDITNIKFSSTTFTSAKVTIEEESMSRLVDYSTAPGVAIGEISIPGVQNAEYIVLPTISESLLSKAQRSTIVLTRQSIDPSIPHRFDTELNLQRILTLPKAQTFSLTGNARLAGRASENLISEFTNLTMANSSRHMFGSAQSIAAFAFDGNLDTAWTTPLDQAPGSEIFFNLSTTSTSPQLRIHVRNDEFHSVPEQITITDSANIQHFVTLTGSDEILTAQLDSNVQFPLRSLIIDTVTSRTFPNYFTKAPRQLPVAITEIDLGSNNLIKTAQIDPECRNDLLKINSLSVSLRIIANDNIFDSSTSFRVEACQEITLLEGENFIQTTRGLDTAVDLDQLVLHTNQISSASSYSPLRITSESRTRISAIVETTSPQIVSFGQSINRGWKATLRTTTATIDLGEPFVVQGYANGWLVPESGELVLEWTPQRFVAGSLLFSGLWALGLLFVALRPRRLAIQVEPTDNFDSKSVIRSKTLVVLIGGSLVAFGGFIPALVAATMMAVGRKFSVAVIAVLMTVITGVIVVQQNRYSYPPTLDWPLRFTDLTPWAWAAVAVACINPALRRT